MTWSLNEIEALSRKAARGAGLTWGLADEAGKAVRWLSARNLPGPEALGRLLQWSDGKSLDRMRPILDGSRWSARTDAVCPILAGSMLSDHCTLIDPDHLVIGPVVAPLLLVPFAAQAAGTLGHALTLEWATARFTLGAEGQLTREGDIAPHGAAVVTLAVSAAAPQSTAREGFRAEADAETIDLLNSFAARTYAPASEESRLAGAGAGLSDND